MAIGTFPTIRGWMLREHEIPAGVPALYRGVWVLLSDDGRVMPA